MKDKQQIRKEIILSAGSVFSKFGYKKTTLEDIARNFGMGKSSLYYYFASKQEIFEAVVIYEAEQLKTELKESMTHSANPSKKLKLYIQTRMKTLRKLSNYYNVIFSEDLGHFDFIERIREKYDHEEVQTLKWILEEGVKQDVFAVENTELAATAICTAMKGLEIPLFWKNKEQQLESRMDDLLMILFYGIIRK